MRVDLGDVLHRDARCIMRRVSYGPVPVTGHEP
jgi:hypothetical protein